MEVLREDPVLTAALALLRRGERHGTGGGVTLVGAPAVIARLGKAKEWIALLERRRGGTVTLRADHALDLRSEERRAGKECVRTFRYRCARYPYKNKPSKH